MARHDLYANPEGEGFIVDLQAGLLDALRTRVVAPLLPLAAVPARIARLHPVFEIGGKKHVMATHLIATVPLDLLREPRGSLADHRDDIVAALDMLFQGF